MTDVIEGRQPQMGSYQLNMDKKELPLLRELVAMINILLQASRRADVEQEKLFDELFPDLYREFVETESEKHDNPPWICCTIDAGARAARGKFVKALEREREGLEHAERTEDEDRRRQFMGWSYGNMTSELRHLDRFDEAVEAGRKAVTLLPDDPSLILELALALYGAEELEDAEHAFDSLKRMADFTDANDAVVQCVRFEDEIRHVDLPSARWMVERCERFYG